MRAIGKRAISFGLVNVPVKIYTATEDHDISLHQVHDEDGGRIRYQRRCEVCGKVVAYENIDRAYESEGQRVIIDEDDLAALPAASREDIDVVEFVPSDQVDPITFERSYYLEPDKGGLKAYVLLRRTLERTERTAIVTFALRNKTHLGVLRVHGDALVLQALLWADELRAADFPSLAGSPRITEKEQQLADALVESLESDFDPTAYHDEYQEQLRELIEAKLAQGDTLDVEEVVADADDEEPEGEVIDLMEALRRSVERRRSGASGGSGTKRAAAGPKSGAKSGAKSSSKSGSKSSSTSSGASGRSSSKSSSTSKPAAKSPAKRQTRKGA